MDAWPSQSCLAAVLILLGLPLAACSTQQSPPPAVQAPVLGPTTGPVRVTVCPPPPAEHRAVANPKRQYTTPPASQLDPGKGYCAYINVDAGGQAPGSSVISVRLRPNDAPLTVRNFIFLATQGFYDGLPMYRRCPDPADASCPAGGTFIETGDPAGTGSRGPGYGIPREPVRGDYVLGSLAMDVDGAASSGSRFLIGLGDNSHLARDYNLFGQVTGGVTVLATLKKGVRISWIDIETTAS